MEGVLFCTWEKSHQSLMNLAVVYERQKLPLSLPFFTVVKTNAKLGQYAVEKAPRSVVPAETH